MPLHTYVPSHVMALSAGGGVATGAFAYGATWMLTLMLTSGIGAAFLQWLRAPFHRPQRSIS